MGCANSKLKVSPEELVNEKIYKKRRPKSWKFWKRVISRCNKVGPVPEHQELDEFQLRLINKKSRPNSAPKKITMELYVPDLEDSEPEDDAIEDKPAVDPNTPQRKAFFLPPIAAKRGFNEKTGRPTVNMRDHLIDKGVLPKRGKQPKPDVDVEFFKGIAFNVNLDKGHKQPPPARLAKMTKQLKNVKSRKEIEDKLEKATERREQQANQKQQRLRLKSARVDKIRKAIQEASKVAQEEAGKELSQKMAKAEERRQEHTKQKTTLMRLKSAKVRKVQDENAVKDEKKHKEIKSKLKESLEKCKEKREQLQKEKLLRVKRVTKAKFTDRDWQRVLDSIIKRKEEERLKALANKPETEEEEEDEEEKDEVRYSIFNQVETYHASSEESLDSFYS